MTLRGRGQSRFDSPRIVLQYAEIRHFEAEALQEALQKKAIGVIDGGRTQRLAGRQDFIAGRKDGGPQLAAHSQPIEPERRGKCDIFRPQPPAPGQSLFAGFQIFAA